MVVIVREFLPKYSNSLGHNNSLDCWIEQYFMAHPTCLNIQLEKTSTVEKGPPVVFDGVCIFSRSAANMEADNNSTMWLCGICAQTSHTPWRWWASNIGFEVPWCFAKQKMSMCALFGLWWCNVVRRILPTMCLASSLCKILSQRARFLVLVRFTSIGIQRAALQVWSCWCYMAVQVFRGIPRVDCEVYGVDVLQSG